MANWPNLPTELHWMIFDFLKEPKNYIDGWKADPYAPARYASVCREWQPIFEQRNFRHLVLDQHRLPDFKRLVVGKRRGYLFSIVLRVKLGEYDCSVCESEEDSQTSKKVFFKTVQDLLRILSPWEKRGRGQGILLDLGAYSPSDGKHTFRDYRLTEGYPYVPCSRGPPPEARYQQHRAATLVQNPADPCPGWKSALKGEPSIFAERRAVAPLCEPASEHFSSLFMYKSYGRRKWRKFPRADVVVNLTIRRHYSRIISPAVLSRLLRQGLSQLRTLRYEKWSGLDLSAGIRFDADIATLLSKHLPPTLRSLHLFEDTESQVHGLNPDRPLGTALTTAARSLTHLSVAFLTDAERFFLQFLPAIQAPDSDYDWASIPIRADYPRLRRLTLSTRYLLPDDAHTDPRARILVMGGVAALYRMPKLRTMELWGVGDGHACVFQYERERKGIRISCVSSWRVRGITGAMEAWRQMAVHAIPGAAVVMKLQCVEGWGAGGCSEVLESGKLRSPSAVVDPVSRLQLKMERRMRQGG